MIKRCALARHNRPKMTSGLSEQAAARAAEELGETPERVATMPGELRKRIQEAAALEAALAAVTAHSSIRISLMTCM